MSNKNNDNLKNQSGAKGKVPEPLNGLGIEIASLDKASKESIVKVGIRLEQSWTELKVAGADTSITDTLKLSLKLLQNIYQDKIEHVDVAWSCVANTLELLEKSVRAGEPDCKLTACYENLQNVLEGKPVELVPENSAEKNSTEQKTRTLEPEDALVKLQQIAADFMLLDDKDTQTVANILQDATRLIPEVCDNANPELDKFCEMLKHILINVAADHTENISLAGELLEKVIQKQDDFINLKPVQNSAPKQDVVPTPQAPVTPPAVETASEQTKDIPQKPAGVTFNAPAVLSDDVDSEILTEYIQESSDHINNAESALLDLESDPTSSEHINVVFRAFHTIKGTSGFLNLDRIQKLAHLAENMLDRARDGEIKITGGYADLALRSCDCLKVMIEGLNGIQPGDALVIPNELDELLSILLDPEAAGYTEQDAAESNDMRIGDILVAQKKVTRKAVENVAKEKGNETIGQALVKSGAVKADQVAQAVRIQNQAKAAVAAEGSIRVGVTRLDNLINMVGELVIAQSMVAQDPNIVDADNTRLRRNILHAGKIIRELQDLTMGLRMVPLKGVFQKMNRLVRDLGRKCGKRVKFSCDGEETEIDRNMVETLNDPLVHMIRNSMDHGVEKPDDREAAGKTPVGSVVLRAYHAGGNVVIELKDDGKGLDRDKILAKAIDKGIVERGRDLTDAEVFMLIFAPGFSTADKITDVSGRGVGMDVVKRNIESLQGRIEVESELGKGTTFTIKLPLTMAITDAMILRVGNDRYLLPTISIEQSFQPEPGSLSTYSGRGEMVLLRGELLPVARLHQLFNIHGSIQDPNEGLLVVIESGGKRCALMVDELLGQQQVVVKSLGTKMEKIPGISGGAILGDGSVGLILDATGLLQLAGSPVHQVEEVLTGLGI